MMGQEEHELCDGLRTKKISTVFKKSQIKNHTIKKKSSPFGKIYRASCLMSRPVLMESRLFHRIQLESSLSFIPGNTREAACRVLLLSRILNGGLFPGRRADSEETQPPTPTPSPKIYSFNGGLSGRSLVVI
jgi:hypothetical protein